MTYEEFLANVKKLDKTKEYNYISNKGKFKLTGVENSIVKILVTKEDLSKKESSVSKNIIEAYLTELAKGYPIDCAKVSGESGSNRSIPPSLLCLMPHIFALKLNKRAHIIELKEKSHNLGELEFINELDIAEKIKLGEKSNREKIESEFKNYLKNIARSKQTGKKLKDSSISSYLLFLKPEKLFDYNPQKWSNIESIYDITSLDKINEILQTLLKDPVFINRNSSDNNGFRARSLKQYRDFLIHQTNVFDNYDFEEGVMQGMKNELSQKIFFGAPGTGKSHKIDYDLFKDENGKPIGMGIKEIPENQKFRTTFHPDYDYAQFVGAYKPKKELNKTTNKEELTYSFVPQVFAKAYAAAWKLYLDAKGDSRDSIGASPLQNDSGKDIQVYLVIEEINRGNCAQIFGDIFQLLDRNDKGFSDYSIIIDSDFADWLKTDSKDGLQTVWNDYIGFSYEKNGEEIYPVSETNIALPPNLNILATMNTSDQSLFPMDSAFKRRFDWEYVPIKYAKDSDCGEDWNADKFAIDVSGSTYMWLDFLKKVNADIYDATQSEDKQMGEFFIKPKSDDLKIAFNEFRSKVLFYLWDSVYKDETERQAVFHFPYGDGDDKIKSVTFQSLFGKDAEAIVNKIMENLKVEKVTA
ncbi:MAG: hypothetical protein IKB43_00040 [Fibrobacter sp.]|nr:hypothetical protein [Fibrobacter sp.]